MERNGLKISKNRLLLNLIFIYIISLGIWDSLTNIFIPNNIRIVLCSLSLFVLLFMTKWTERMSPLPCDILFILSILVYCINNYYIEINNSFGYLRYFLLFALLFIGRTIYNFPNRIVKLYTYMSLIHVFATIWLKFDAYSYKNIIVKMFDAKRQSLLLAHYAHGWISGLANHYSSNGMYLATTILLLFSYILFSDSNRRKKQFKLLFCLAFLALLFTGKRAHMIFSVMAMLLVYYIYSANKKHGRFFKILTIVIGVIGFFYIGYSLFPNLFSFIGRFYETAEDGDVTQGRLTTWTAVMSVFRTSPLFGIGWMRFSTLAEGFGVTSNAHNVYIQLLCETGIVGFTVFVAMFVSMFAISVYLFSKMRTGRVALPDEEQKNMAFSIGMQLFFLLYCFSGNPLYDAPMFVPYFLSLGITTYYWCLVRTLNNTEDIT
jgi:O-antigen ligase